MMVRSETVLVRALLALCVFFVLGKAANAFPGPEKADSLDEYYDPSHLRYDNYIYKEYIETVLLHRRGFELSMPMITLGSTEQLHLQFDDLSDEVKDYAFELVHCSANWDPTDFMPMEFITGMTYDYITDYAQSRNTLENFTHYNLYFPYSGMELTKSGNYIVKVYDNDDPEDVVLTWRFMVVEPRVRFSTRVHGATDVSQRFTHQEVDFQVFDDQGYELIDPYNSVSVVIMQNNRWDNAIYNLEPRFVKQNELDYDYEYGNVFLGGNEFRMFDTRDLNFAGAFMDSIRYNRADRREHAYTEPAKNRAYLTYLDRDDINGKRLIKKLGFANSDVEADYVWVHFTLPVDDPYTGGDFYVFGGLSDWRINSRYRMKYNPEKNAYETKLYLKQGYYNYQYLFLKDGERKGDERMVEGSHAQTENEYAILVYHRNTGDIYDRLVGVEAISYLR